MMMKTKKTKTKTTTTPTTSRPPPPKNQKEEEEGRGPTRATVVPALLAATRSAWHQAMAPHASALRHAAVHLVDARAELLRRGAVIAGSAALVRPPLPPLSSSASSPSAEAVVVMGQYATLAPEAGPCYRCGVFFRHFPLHQQQPS
jgi:hypothetical protein